MTVMRCFPFFFLIGLMPTTVFAASQVYTPLLITYAWNGELASVGRLFPEDLERQDTRAATALESAALCRDVAQRFMKLEFDDALAFGDEIKPEILGESAYEISAQPFRLICVPEALIAGVIAPAEEGDWDAFAFEQAMAGRLEMTFDFERAASYPLFPLGDPQAASTPVAPVPPQASDSAVGAPAVYDPLGVQTPLQTHFEDLWQRIFHVDVD